MARPKIGDVIEIETSRGLAYALYTHENKTHGSLLRVFERTFPSRPASFGELVKEPLQFETFFPLGAAVHRKIVAIAGHAAVPKPLQRFPLFRAQGGISREGKVLNWWLWDGKREWFIGNSLTEEQKTYPLRGIVNDTLLREWIEQGWRCTDHQV